jgi:hypothetical protein
MLRGSFRNATMDNDEGILSGIAYGLWAIASSVCTGIIIYGFVVLIALAE